MKIPRKIPIIPKYLILNAQALIYTSWIFIFFVSFIVFLGLHKSILTEITEILMILAILLFLFLFIGLYRGMILQEEEPHVLNDMKINIEKTNLGIAPSSFPSIDLSNWINWIFIAIITIWLFSYLLFFGLYFLILMLMVLYVIFYLAYGMVFRHSQDIKGDVIKSLGYSVMYTVLYTGVFFILIQVVKYFGHAT